MVQTRAEPAQKVNGPALRVIRERTGVSCSALAREVGADVSFLARVERGEKRGMRRETFERICWVLKIGDPRAIMADPFGPVTHATLLTREPVAHDGLQCVSTTRTAA